MDVWKIPECSMKASVVAFGSSLLRGRPFWKNSPSTVVAFARLRRFPKAFESFPNLRDQYRQNHGEQGDAPHSQAEGRLPEGVHIALGDDERLPEGPFHDRSQDQSHDQRGRFIVEFAHDIAQDARAQHHPDVEKGAVVPVGADRAQNQDDRHQVEVGYPDDLGEDSHQRKVQDQQHHIAEIEAADHPPEDIGPVAQQKGARGDAVQKHPPQQDGGRRGERQPQREQRDHGAARRRIVGRFGTGHPFNGALSRNPPYAWRSIFPGHRTQKRPWLPPVRAAGRSETPAPIPGPSGRWTVSSPSGWDRVRGTGPAEPRSVFPLRPER